MSCHISQQKNDLAESLKTVSPYPPTFFCGSQQWTVDLIETEQGWERIILVSPTFKFIRMMKEK